MKFFEKIID